MRTHLRTAALLTLTGLAVAFPALAAGEPLKDIKSGDVAVQLEAIGELAKGSVEGGEAALLDALKDKDWEVVERAATALGKVGGEKAVKPLVDLAVTGPIRRVRHAAAVAAGALDQEKSIKLLSKKATGKKTAEAAFEALAMFANKTRAKDAWKAIDKGLKNKEPFIRAAAAMNVGAFEPEAGAERLSKVLGDKDLSVVANGLESVIDYPAEEHLPVLLSGLGKQKLKDVIERRITTAVRSVIATAQPGAVAATVAAPILDAASADGPAYAQTRVARLIGLIAEKPPAPEKEDEEPSPPLIPSKDALESLARILGHEEADPRAAAVHALGLVGSDEALAKAREFARSDADPRVRMHALRAVLRNHTVRDEETYKLAVDRLGYDSDLLVREEAAVALGVRKIEGAVPVLARVLREATESPKDKWALGTCCAVSLGKTWDPEALTVLTEVWEESKNDWRLRASSLVGLGHLSQNAAVPKLIAALKEKNPVFRRVAYEALRRLTTKDLEAKSSQWEEWWAEVGDNFIFEDREELAKKAKKYGYALSDAGVYEGLDTIVLQSRGDSIEKLLEKLGIDHRITRGGQVPASGLHPWGVFVSNCTGEVTPKDIEQIQWFVRSGGYLFCSCWALHHTAEKVYPGIEGYQSPVRKLYTQGQVLENVIARSCASRSPFLKDVFDGVTRPIYVLYGAHLIEVMDRERVEVLVDSPHCATGWGGGNLACWFNAGHGVILDSSNHFDLQGLEKAPGVSKPEEIMAYAMDHMGLDYEEVRKYREAGHWKSKAKAHKVARDLSAFRLITNFVRAKRKSDQ